MQSATESQKCNRCFHICQRCQNTDEYFFKKECVFEMLQCIKMLQVLFLDSDPNPIFAVWQSDMHWFYNINNI